METYAPTRKRFGVEEEPRRNRKGAAKFARSFASQEIRKEEKPGAPQDRGGGDESREVRRENALAESKC